MSLLAAPRNGESREAVDRKIGSYSFVILQSDRTIGCIGIVCHCLDLGDGSVRSLGKMVDSKALGVVGQRALGKLETNVDRLRRLDFISVGIGKVHIECEKAVV